MHACAQGKLHKRMAPYEWGLNPWPRKDQSQARGGPPGKTRLILPLSLTFEVGSPHLSKHVAKVGNAPLSSMWIK